MTLTVPLPPWSPGIFMTFSRNKLALGFPGGAAVKNLPAVQETQDRSLGWEDPLEKAMAPHSSTLAWKIPWTEEPGRLHGVAESDTTEQLHFLSLS